MTHSSKESGEEIIKACIDCKKEFDNIIENLCDDCFDRRYYQHICLNCGGKANDYFHGHCDDCSEKIKPLTSATAQDLTRITDAYQNKCADKKRKYKIKTKIIKKYLVEK
jgi:hypothetical protein